MTEAAGEVVVEGEIVAVETAEVDPKEEDAIRVAREKTRKRIPKKDLNLDASRKKIKARMRRAVRKRKTAVLRSPDSEIRPSQKNRSPKR